MSTETEYLKLLKKDPIADKNDTFNLKTMLNDNWDKLDAFAASVPLFKVGSYTVPNNGGGSGSANPNTITDIGFVPDFVFVTDVPSKGSYEGVKLLRPFSSDQWVVTWGANSVQWYYTGSGTASPDIQCNRSGGKYHYVIFGHKEAGA